MKYMLAIYTEEGGNEDMPPEAMKAELDKWWQYGDALEEAGVHIAGDALQPSETATTVKLRNGERIVTDGPFTETKEQLGGYYLLDCPDLDTALDWASKMPNLDRNTVEVRPLMEFEREPA
jgi:hypothetical protein